MKSDVEVNSISWCNSKLFAIASHEKESNQFEVTCAVPFPLNKAFDIFTTTFRWVPIVLTNQKAKLLGGGVDWHVNC